MPGLTSSGRGELDADLGAAGSIDADALIHRGTIIAETSGETIAIEADRFQNEGTVRIGAESAVAVNALVLEAMPKRVWASAGTSSPILRRP